ncbi:MAG TPA: hypothetical protein VIJ39_08420 [Solirubrobacteraceae bacterium]
MAARRVTLSIVVCLCVVVGGLTLASVSALAANTHEYLSQLTGFENPTAVAFDASGDVYVVDNGAKTVDRFSSTGAPLAFSASGSYIEGSKLTGDPTGAGGSLVSFESPDGVAVNDESGDIYVSDTERHIVDVFSSTGQYLSQITEVPASSGAPVQGSFQYPSGLTVDQSTHDLYVTDPHSEVVDVFSSTGAYVTQFGQGILGGAYGETIGVNDLTETAYVGDSSCDCVDVFGSTDSFIPPEWHGASTPYGSFGSGYVYVGLDPTTGHVYVAATSPDVVDEFNSSTSEEYIEQLTGTPTGENGSLVPFGYLQDVAVNPVGGDLYVADSNGVVDVFSPDTRIPATTVRPPTSVSNTTATVSGTVNPEGVQVTSCEFEYGTSASYGQIAPCEQSPADIGAGTVPVTVTAELTALQPNTTYHYRLKAATEGSSTSGDETFGSPVLGEQSVSDVSASGASFQAQVDPGGAETTYSFEYGTSSAYGASVPLPAGTISAGNAAVTAEAHAQGLLANTTYHYHVVAANALGTVAGPDQVFTTQSIGLPFQLPDGRAWEMVSPPQKEGARLGWILEDIIQASANGTAFTDWTFFQPSGKAEGSDNLDTTFFGRGPDGWSSRVITPPHNQDTGVSIGQGNEYPFFSEDLSKSVLKPFGGFMALSPEATEPTAYVRSDYLNGNPSGPCTSDCYQPLVTAANVPSETKFGEDPKGECEGGRVECGPEFVDGTPDLDHIVLSSPVALTSGSEGGLYEWTAGQLTFIGSGELGTGGGESKPDQRHGISNDGTRVIFDNSAGYYEPSEGLRGLLMRDTATGKTLRIDAPNADVPPGQGEGEASYMTASSEESRIFFLDAPGLTSESSTGGPDLYEYNLNAPAGSRLTDLSVDKSAPGPAEVQMVIGASEDGSYVYFVASGALAQGASPGRNLYVSHDGIVEFIAELSLEDPDWSTSLEDLGARVSPNGRWLAFMSNRDLTGYDTTDAFSGHPDEEVYLYDASSNKLVCASCNPTGARPVGVEATENPGIVGATGFIASGTWAASNVPPWTKYKLGAALYQSRYLSNSGRLLFDSNDALAPQDVNGTQDVYEYEPDDYENAEGKRECGEESVTFSKRSDGCVGLISSGASSEESAFLDASETGGDVFFLTSAKLLPQDVDNAPDIYDARECDAVSPCVAPPPVPPPPCDTGDSCKPAQSAQPTVFGPAPSATFSGVGNVAAQGSQPAASPRSLTRAQKLARALRACRRIKGKHRRSTCQRRARKSYGVARKARKSRPRPRPAGQGAEEGNGR